MSEQRHVLTNSIQNYDQHQQELGRERAVKCSVAMDGECINPPMGQLNGVSLNILTWF